MRGKGGLAPWVPWTWQRKVGLVARQIVAFLIAFRTIERLEAPRPKTMMQTHQMSDFGSRTRFAQKPPGVQPRDPAGVPAGPRAISLRLRDVRQRR